MSNGVAVAGVTVGFGVVGGPSIGLVGTGTTDAAGKASFTYTRATPGIDYIEARFTANGRTQTSNRVTKTWYAKPLLSHYLCYPLGPTLPAFTQKNVFLDDQFAHARPAKVLAPTELCNPVRKTRLGTVYLPQNPTSHLVCHPGSFSGGDRRKVTIVDQFGSRPLVIGSPFRLCLPSTARRGQPFTSSPLPLPVPPKLAHYQCYPVIEDPATSPLQLVVKLGDSFWPWNPTATVVKPKTLCTPTRKKWNNNPWTPAVNQKDHLVCYSIALPNTFGPARKVRIRNQFDPLGTRTGYAYRPNWLCVPAVKILGG